MSVSLDCAVLCDCWSDHPNYGLRGCEFDFCIRYYLSGTDAFRLKLLLPPDQNRQVHGQVAKLNLETHQRAQPESQSQEVAEWERHFCLVLADAMWFSIEWQWVGIIWVENSLVDYELVARIILCSLWNCLGPFMDQAEPIWSCALSILTRYLCWPLAGCCWYSKLRISPVVNIHSFQWNQLGSWAAKLECGFPCVENRIQNSLQTSSGSKQKLLYMRYINLTIGWAHDFWFSKTKLPNASLEYQRVYNWDC